MSTITLYARKVNRMPSLIRDVRSSVREFRSEVEDLRNSTMSIDSSVCNLDDVIASLRASSNTQEEKLEKLEDIKEEVEEFIDDVVSIDEDAAEAINQSKDDFYDEYYYLKPDCEKSGWEKFKDGLKDFGNWCKEHWKQIVLTVVIVVGVVLAVVAVVATGGAALVPLLAGILTSCGVAAGTATTIATVISFTVAAIAIVSAVTSGALNVVDTWKPLSGGWKTFQTVMNWTSLISNGIYGIGSLYSGFKGITNQELFNYGKSYLTNGQFRLAITEADKYRFVLETGKSTFWSGLGANGDQAAARGAQSLGRTTMEEALNNHGITMPNWDPNVPSSIVAWNSSSSSFAMRSSGSVYAILGKTVNPNGVWSVFERTLLGVNPSVTSITLVDQALNVTSNVVRTPQVIQMLINGSGPVGQFIQSAYENLRGSD